MRGLSARGAGGPHRRGMRPCLPDKMEVTDKTKGINYEAFIWLVVYALPIRRLAIVYSK